IAKNKDPDVVAAKAVLTRAIEARAATPGDPQLDVAVETAELALENAIIGIDVKAAAAAAKAKAAEDATKSVSKCPPGGIGWILCPVLNTMGFMADTMLSLFKGFLQVDAPSILNVGGDTYKVWQQILSVANVIFVIVFLVVVFSQISNVGITNYGIKKILPKLIIAVILVNLSFYICQIAVDLSNLVGNSLQNLIDSFAKTPSPLAADDFWSNLLTGTAAGATGVLVVTAGLAIAWANIAAIIPALIAALIALLLILFILVSRQALIVLLTIVAPLAFVAMVLPNTEKLFKTWQKTFMSMLLLYPIVTGVFGVAKFASGLLFNLHETDMLWQIMAGAVSIVPLFVVPLLLKSSMNGIGKLGSTLNGLGDKWGKGAGAKYTNSDLAKNYAAKKAERQAQINAGTYSGRGGNWNPANLRSRLHGGANKNRAYNWATAGLGGKTDLDAMAKGRKEVSESTALFDGDDKLAQVYAETGGGENINGTIDPATGLNANGLNKAQLARLQLMRNTGQHKKASSFLAASKLMAEKGAGNMADYTNAINQARARGASETQLLESSEDISAAYIT
ncbi:MAG: hypothetical protein WCP03_04785, partial [Candidatus Saccharibacteria bacterium]